ncbi:MarR family transcriptional regulator [Clostridium bowmanii]|uniref:MarR family winged helix-turn-helix transcriptional regulator n=1 Tax=Clostridium bowmanii TaxID=132925 RepID=UPI001C0AEBD3|nr:MarR family transcriptional regulator [Clostridium bowmanii]MBU3191373.1 MarR family transcriptional regulator [Clostridium bowmanii]MCA1075782.1 MarR family transcriptional regulator [Clostridium bowmanii]
MRKIIGRNISILYRNEKNFVDAMLKKDNLNKVQAEVLLFLRDHNGANLTGINELFLFNKATITKIITHLEKYNYVNRVVSESDRREKGIYLTDSGINIVPSIIEVLKAWEDILIYNISNADIEKVRSILAKMVDNVTTLKENKQ